VNNGEIKRSYTLKVTGKNQGSNNLPLLLQALPQSSWSPPKDWPLPEETPPIEVKHNFTTISPTKPFKPSFTKNF
jgi:hypothetical protein